MSALRYQLFHAVGTAMSTDNTGTTSSSMTETTSVAPTAWWRVCVILGTNELELRRSKGHEIR